MQPFEITWCLVKVQRDKNQCTAVTMYNSKKSKQQFLFLLVLIFHFIHLFLSSSFQLLLIPFVIENAYHRHWSVYLLKHDTHVQDVFFLYIQPCFLTQHNVRLQASNLLFHQIHGIKGHRATRLAPPETVSSNYILFILHFILFLVIGRKKCQ